MDTGFTPGVVEDQVNPEHPDNTLFAWIVTPFHLHCDKCRDQVESAITDARVTGSVGATRQLDERGIGGELHGAKVERQSMEERRKELGL